MENSREKDTRNFLAVTFALTAIIGIVLACSYYFEFDASSLPLLQMHIPALVVIIIAFKNNDKRDLPTETFYLFIGATMTQVAISICSFFGYDFVNYLQFVFYIINILFVLSLVDKKQKNALSEWGLAIKNIKKTAFFVLLYFGLYILSVAMESIYYGDFSVLLNAHLVTNALSNIVTLCLSFVISCTLFFGEEYGWRYFLQPRLQEKFGMRKGVILLGIIWGLWHFALNLFYYTTPEFGLYSVLSQVGSCICYAIIFGYIYMKTESVWSVAIIHCLHNTMPAFLGVTISETYSGNNYVELIIGFAINFIVFGSFIFSKVYRR